MQFIAMFQGSAQGPGAVINMAKVELETIGVLQDFIFLFRLSYIMFLLLNVPLHHFSSYYYHGVRQYATLNSHR